MTKWCLQNMSNVLYLSFLNSICTNKSRHIGAYWKKNMSTYTDMSLKGSYLPMFIGILMNRSGSRKLKVTRYETPQSFYMFEHL